VHSILKRIALAALAFALSTPFARGAEDWPKWMGPHGDNISKETIPDAAWPEGGPKKLWTKKVGFGHSSPVAAGGKVYVFSLVEFRSEVLTALDANTGQEVWKQSYFRSLVGGGSQMGNPEWDGTRATPTIDGDAIYTFGSLGDLVCRNLSDGKLRWQINVLKETGGDAPAWGTASSPLVDGERVYVQAGIGDGAPLAVGVDKKTGKVAWQSEAKGVAGGGGKEASGASYAAIVPADVDGEKQIIVFAARDLYGMDPATGKTRWSEPWPTQYDVNGSTPVVRDGKLLVTSEYDTSKAALFKLKPDGLTKLWESKALRSRFQPVIVENGYIYANSFGNLICLTWADGKIAWEAKDRALRLGVGGTILRVGGDKMLTMSETGNMTLATVTPKGAKAVGAPVEVFEGKNNWATPLMYDGKIFAKGQDEIVAFDVRGK
jgi:outer membrane protein assembly factor BamB